MLVHSQNDRAAKARGFLVTAWAVVRFLLPSLAGLLLGATAGLVYGLVLVGTALSKGGFPAAAHVGPIVLVLLAFPPAIAALFGANAGYLLALFVECAVILARRAEIGAPRRVAKLGMFVAGAAVAIAFFAFRHGADEELALLADFIVAAGALVPASLVVAGVAALVARHRAR